LGNAITRVKSVFKSGLENAITRPSLTMDPAPVGIRDAAVARLKLPTGPNGTDRRE
jgi:hypothetical protein